MLTLTLNEDNHAAAKLTFASDRLGRLGRLNAAVVDISRRWAPERRAVEEFIASVYADAYDARIVVAYPTLMSVRDKEGRLLAAAGFRFASEAPLFLEQYTRAPIEQKVGEAHGCAVARRAIAEVGNLVSSGQGATVFLYAALAAWLDHNGILYAVATGTGELHRQLLRLGIAAREICVAEQCALSAPSACTWGRYYETRPRVLSGSIAEGMRELKDRLGAEYHSSGLTSRLHYGCADA